MASRQATRFLVPFCRSDKKGLAGYAGETAAHAKHDEPVITETLRRQITSTCQEHHSTQPDFRRQPPTFAIAQPQRSADRHRELLSNGQAQPGTSGLAAA